MNEDVLDEQRELVKLVEAAGWDVTEAELSVYESPFADDETPEATVTISARKQFPDDGDGDEDEDDTNRFRVE